MSKKIIALILILPLILMVTLYSAVNMVSIQVKVPVSNIELRGDDFITLDLDKGERYAVDYVVYPTNASNKKVNFSVDPVLESEEIADLEYKDGYIYPKSAGRSYARFSTADGGFRARIQVLVKSTKLREISCSIDSTIFTVGQTEAINTTFKPTTASNTLLTYSSSDNDIASVSDTGIIRANGKGIATITIRSVEDESISDTIDVIVKPDEPLALGGLKGSTTGSSIAATTWDNTGSIHLTVDAIEEYGMTYQFLNESGNELNNVISVEDELNPFTSKGDGNYDFNYKFLDENFVGKVVIKFTLITQIETVSKEFTITKIADLEANFTSEEDLEVKQGSIINWIDYINISPDDAKVSYSVSYSNSNVSSLGSIAYYAQAQKMGYTTATITIQTGAEHSNQTVELVKNIYVYPEELVIKETQMGSSAIEQIPTIGKQDVNGNEINHQLSLYFDESKIGANFNKVLEKITFETSQPDKVAVENQVIKIKDETFNGIVDISAKINLGTQVKDTIRIRCVGNGVEVSNFLDLYAATKMMNKSIVLQGDIVKDFGKKADGSDFYTESNVEKIYSTYNTKFYENQGLGKPQVKTLLQFKNNVYGNGYIINADNVAGTDNTGNPKGLFAGGPLNLVALGDLASVKAQDNICFAVFENVTLNNVELKGCNLLDKDGMINLNNLNYAGTVVEVLGDKVNIEYCRISHGRTVLRAFGDVNDADKVININIKNSVLSQAREFIIRTGSNKLVRSDENVSYDSYHSPYIDEETDEKLSFPVQEDYEKNKEKYQEDYEDKYIKTKITIENSVLRDSGIFCIGIESHFAGKMLFDALQTKYADNWKDQLIHWQGMDATSYGAKVTFEGDVRIYDWKDLKNVDSSTLIEFGPTIDQFESIKELLTFDIASMINSLIEREDEKTTIVYDNQYVHGGIVFFGGGLNYGLFEDNSTPFKGILEDVELSRYKIRLADTDMGFLEAAAGEKPFYFILYGEDSAFTPPEQDKILAGENGVDAYDCIYTK